MMHLIAFFTLLGFAAASADTSTTYWIKPGHDDASNTSIAWNLGEQQVVVWNTDLSTFDVSLWQHDSGSVSTENTTHNRGTVYSQTDPQNNVSNVTWVVQLYGNYVHNSSTFFFKIASPGTDGYSSAHFTINGDSTTDTNFLGLHPAGMRALAIGLIVGIAVLLMLSVLLLLCLCTAARRLKTEREVVKEQKDRMNNLEFTGTTISTTILRPTVHSTAAPDSGRAKKKTKGK